MKQRVYYVSRDPAHAGWWIVAAAAMRALSFQSRGTALQWAFQQAAGAPPGVSARVLVQDAENEWLCHFANDLPPAKVGPRVLGASL
jgi:hypothetical protein